MLVLAAACLLLVGVGIGLLIPRMGTNDGNISMGGNKPAGFLPKKETVEMKQVIPMQDGAVAALYTDGTVRVSGNAAFSQVVSQWDKVSKLYTYTDYFWGTGENLLGLTQDGTVLATDGNPSGWVNVKELYFSWQGIVGVTHDGRILTYGEWEGAKVLTGLSNVDSLANCLGLWGCLKKDGSVTFISGDGFYVEEDMPRWTNVKELCASDHGLYAIMKDGTVEGQFDETYSGLTGAVKIVDFEDWLFGISADGRLMTHNDGNISPNWGDLTVVTPEEEGYFPDVVDIRRFDQLKDIVPFCGLILLNEDGTAEYIGAECDWDLSSWNGIEKACGRYSEDGPILYGIRKDGSVIMHTYGGYQDQYRGWKLKDIYTGSEGAVGLTMDGKLVADGIYEGVDFSVFD